MVPNTVRGGELPQLTGKLQCYFRLLKKTGLPMTFLLKVNRDYSFSFFCEDLQKNDASVADFSFGIGYRLSCFILSVAVNGFLFFKLSVKN
jgi:hypothetical protein